VQPLHHLVVDQLPVGLPQLDRRSPIAILRAVARNLLQRLPQVLVFLTVADATAPVVVPGRARQFQAGQNGSKPMRSLYAAGKRHFLFAAHPFRPKRFWPGDLHFLPAQQLLQVRQASLVLLHCVVLAEDLRPPLQELLLPQAHRIGVDAILLGDLARRLLAGHRLQDHLEFEFRGVPPSGHG
jgi:hypothetical protein